MRHDRRGRSLFEGLITALAVGGTFIIIGLMFVLTPNLWEKATAFFNGFTTVSYPLSSTNTLSLFVPADPAAHISFFTAVMYFILSIGILQVIILALRLTFRSPIRRIAETVGNLVFWLGGAVVANVLLLAGTLSGWFSFWAWLIILVGLSMIARFGVYFATRSKGLQKAL
jgi:hypothetical protein